MKQRMGRTEAQRDILLFPAAAGIELPGYEGWWVVEAEQDLSLANPLAYAIKARKYIRDKAGL